MVRAMNCLSPHYIYPTVSTHIKCPHITVPGQTSKLAMVTQHITEHYMRLEIPVEVSNKKSRIYHHVEGNSKHYDDNTPGEHGL